MEVSFDTDYGLQWFRAEASALSYEKRRHLYNKISQWEYMAKNGPQGWAHAQGEAARELGRRPLTGHMRELLIEVKGLSWVEATDANYLNTKRAEYTKKIQRQQKEDAYNAKLDSALDELLKE